MYRRIIRNDMKKNQFITVATVAGFLRDSQMNASLASSKRFLISENEYKGCISNPAYYRI